MRRDAWNSLLDLLFGRQLEDVAIAVELHEAKCGEVAIRWRDVRPHPEDAFNIARTRDQAKSGQQEYLENLINRFV